MRYNPEKHHRRSIRLKGYDYSKNGLYFITICVKNREHLFGKIKDEQIILNEYGKIAKYKWFDLPNHNENIILHEFIVMPNHIHGIIEIDNDKNRLRAGLEPAPTRIIGNIRKKQPLSEIIRQYKTFSAKEINKLRDMQGISVWQRNYYENIIRDEKSYLIISKYIRTNPQKWVEDKYFV